MYFHARYHQEYPPEMGQPYTGVRAEARALRGNVLSFPRTGSVTGSAKAMIMFRDGEQRPSLPEGTGTEDYFNEAWNMRSPQQLCSPGARC